MPITLTKMGYEPVADCTRPVTLFRIQICSVSNYFFAFFLHFPLRTRYKTGRQSSRLEHTLIAVCLTRVESRHDGVMDQQVFSFLLVSVDHKTRPASASMEEQVQERVSKRSPLHHYLPLQEFTDALSWEDSTDSCGAGSSSEAHIV